MSGRTVLTIHDLIKHLSTGPTTTTLPAWQYRFKHFTYRFLVRRLLHHASALITPSHYWKHYLLSHYHLDPTKIFVTYEAASPHFTYPKKVDKTVLARYQLTKPFLVYTGNLYPHKNVPILISAVNHFNKTHQTKLTLALVAARSAFQKQIKPSSYIRPLGFVADPDLPHLYAQAIALVQPSLIEGFGLTGLEAMQCKLPVLSSNSTCLPEVYSQAALYFDPYSQTDLEEKLAWIVKEASLRHRLVQRGLERAKDFTWHTTAHATLSAYHYALQKPL